jgi:hypothetical protein
VSDREHYRVELQKGPLQDPLSPCWGMGAFRTPGLGSSHLQMNKVKGKVSPSGDFFAWLAKVEIE